MLKKLIRAFRGAVREFHKEIVYHPPIAEYGEALQETKNVRHRLGAEIEAWEKRTGRVFNDKFEDLPPDADGWSNAQQKSFSAFFGSLEYEKARLGDVKKDVVKTEPMCSDCSIINNEVSYVIDGKGYFRTFGTDEEAHAFAEQVIKAKKSIYSPKEE